MFGRTDFFPYFVFTISIISIATDLIRGRIYNWLTLPAILSGLIVSGIFLGWSGILASLGAIGLGMLLYGWMFWFGAMGGGDVKLLMALGAWGGIRFVIDVGILGVVLGGILAIGMLLVKGRLIGFFSRLYRFLLSVFVKELEPELPKINHDMKMPFGIPISIAAVWIVLDNPFVKWGIHL